MRKWIRRGLLGLLALGILLLAVLGGSLYGSLPALDGERTVAGLTAAVTIERDALGVPTVHGSNRADVARATGFLHAQDRFFQMDLLRRRAAGELAEIVGPAALPLDRAVRVHGFRAVARKVIAAAAPPDRSLLEAYTAGVNAGLATLRVRPWEYVALRGAPAPWLPEDTILCSLAMFLTLHDSSGGRESALGLMHDLLPAPVFDFLTPTGTEWDAPLVGAVVDVPPVPGPDVLDLRTRKTALRDVSPQARLRDEDDRSDLGSNDWAVDGKHTADGGALVANDMHLGISVPNTWYRMSLVWQTPAGTESRATGATLPGAPTLIVGSNTHVAWGFTNTEGDWIDLVIVEFDPADKDRYRTAEGPRPFEHRQERVHVRGGADEIVEVLDTIWGPVVDKDHLGRPRALRWTAHDPEASNPGLNHMEAAGSLDEAVAIANGAGVPPENFVCADSSGRVGWTIIGVMPKRVGFDGRLPTSWADGAHRWDGWLAPAEYPRVLDPANGRVWTANGRVVDGEMLRREGHGGYALGARARQIRDDLLALDHATPKDLLGVQLDDRALFLARWRELMLKTLSASAVASQPKRAEVRALVEGWGGRASVDSVGYRLVRGFRATVAEAAFAPIVAPCRAADAHFDYLASVSQYEGPLWRLVSERPGHLLDPRHRDWDELLLAAVDHVIDDLTKDGGRLAARTWGERNTAHIQHPLSRSLTFLRRFLDMPEDPLPGDANMPRFQSPSSGASERMVVSPGREAAGFFHMPGGESGHPFSPFYRAGHTAWERGDPTPFLPGPTVHTLVLKP